MITFKIVCCQCNPYCGFAASLLSVQTAVQSIDTQRFFTDISLYSGEHLRQPVSSTEQSMPLIGCYVVFLEQSLVHIGVWL